MAIEGPPTTTRDTAAGLNAEELRTLLDAHGRTLLALAAAGIRRRLETGVALDPDLRTLSADLAQPGAAFITLTRHDELRGCIGSIQAWRPLAVDVVANAVSAAFEDPRFSPLAADELAGLAISASVLTAPEPVDAASEAELLAKLRPGRDGVVLREGKRQGVFLPQMWERTASPQEFLAWLKEKAGLPRTHWSADLHAFRFETVSIATDDPFAEAIR